MVLDTSMSLLPCRSTRRPSQASKQNVQAGMGGNNVRWGRDGADSSIQISRHGLSSLQLGRANSEKVQDHEMYSGVYVILHSHAVNLPIAALHDCSNFNVATLCKLHRQLCRLEREFASRTALVWRVMLVHYVLPIVSILCLLMPIPNISNP